MILLRIIHIVELSLASLAALHVTPGVHPHLDLKEGLCSGNSTKFPIRICQESITLEYY